MKRSAFPFVLAALIAVMIAFSFQQDPSPDIGTFDGRFRSVLQDGGYAVLSEVPVALDQVPLPFLVQWHPRRWRTGSNPDAANAGSAERLTLSRHGNPKFDCFVRFTEDRAQVIAIEGGADEMHDAAELRASLRQQFPGFPVQLR